jgi:hypothetical protein
MDDETTNLVFGDDLMRSEEDFAGRKVGVKSEEDKVVLLSRDGKETTAIAIAIVGSINRSTSCSLTSRKYSAIVKAVRPTLIRAPGGSFI